MSEQVRRGVALGRSMEYIRVAGGQVAAAGVGFLASRACVMNQYAPFGISICAASPRDYVLASGIGAILGYMIPANGWDPFRNIMAVFAAASVKWILSGILKAARTPLFASILALITSLVCGFMLTSTLSPIDVLGVLVFGLMGAGAAYFFHQTWELARSSRKPGSFSVQELGCMAISFSILLTAVIPLEIYGISPARALCIVLILSAARYGREAMGAIAGICIGFAVSLSGGEISILSASYAFAGLISGIFSRLGNVGTAAAFVIANGIFALQAASQPGLLPGIYEVFIGSIIFMVLPGSITQKMVEYLSPAAQIPGSDGLRKTLVLRLRGASAALSDVSQTVEEVSARLRDITAPDFDCIFTNVENDTCKACGLRVYCWEGIRSETIHAMMEIIKGIRAGNSAGSSLPEEFEKRCPRSAAIAESLLVQYTDYTARESAIRRIDEVRSVVSDQFEGISDMLYDMAVEFEESQHCDPEAAELVEQGLLELGVVADAVTCTVDKFGRMTVDIMASSPTHDCINRSVIMRELSQLLCRDFDIPCISGAGGRAHITLNERANFITDFGAVQFSCSGARMCGDAYQFFNDGKGRAIMLISDGMGNGGRAAVDGAMASGLMARLIKAGFSFDCALKIVNSAMLFKSTDESLATIDISCVDLFTGQTQLLKAGAPPTIVRRNGRTGRAECSSLPAGILREIEFDEAKIQVQAGDVILMMSDGATSEGTDWICAELEAWSSGDAQSLAQHIATCARRRRRDRREDDITVLALILEEAV